MGYQPHDMFKTPSDDTVIWQYIPIEKFLSSLNENSLYFTHPSKFEDQLEGNYPEETYKSLWNCINLLDERLPIKKSRSYEFHRKMFDEMCNDDSNEFVGPIEKEDMPLLIHINKLTQEMSNLIFCNCWTVSKKENATHWWRYGGSPTTVAVMSTIGRLREALSAKEGVHIGHINYIDYNSEHTYNYEKIMESGFKDKDNLIDLVYSLYLNKDDRYGDESEVRCILSYRDAGKYIEELIPNKKSPFYKGFHTYIKSLTNLDQIPIFEADMDWKTLTEYTRFGVNGVPISVDLKRLIKKIVISPKAEPYLRKTLQQTVEKYRLERDIVEESSIP